MGAIQWLIFCGVALVIAITLGTACLVLQFRDRALQVAERELNNSTLLVAPFRPANDRPSAHPG
jgi:hypothetical protein